MTCLQVKRKHKHLEQLDDDIHYFLKKRLNIFLGRWKTYFRFNQKENNYCITKLTRLSYFAKRFMNADEYLA